MEAAIVMQTRAPALPLTTLKLQPNLTTQNKTKKTGTNMLPCFLLGLIMEKLRMDGPPKYIVTECFFPSHGSEIVHSYSL
jgi:hypothetical protein